MEAELDRLAAMEVFVSVAESGSFTEAARRARTSKSLASRLVSSLETELGVRLFQRTTRSLTLTEAGRGYYERTTRILADIEEANLAAADMQAVPKGRLRITAPVSFGYLNLAAAVCDFMEVHEQVDIEMIVNDRYVDLIEGGFDLAIRIGKMTDSGLIARKLAPMPKVTCASPVYLAARGIPQIPNDLKQHECLSYSNLTSANEWRFRDPSSGKTIALEVKGRFQTNNGDAMRIAALRGRGIVILPGFIVEEDVKAGRLVPLLEPYTEQESSIHAVYPHGRHLSPKTRVFIDFLVERFGGSS